MTIDIYTKAVLTVIAGALVTLAWQGGVGSANAIGQGCGTSFTNACYVQTGPLDTLRVEAR